MTIQDSFWNFINGFIILKQFPIMWITFRMIITVFATIAVLFALGVLISTDVIVHGIWILVALVGYFGYLYIKLYKHIRSTKSNL